MILSTMNDLPGYQVTEEMGEVCGELRGIGQEICAYGTAVTVVPAR
jgi:uncharacterized protein YbjQ (UPF0145 family)